MGYDFFTIRSITYGQRGERLLRDSGISCALLRTPRWMEEQGCGYCLRVSHDYADRAQMLLRQNGIPVRRRYAQRQDGMLEEWT